MVVYGEETYRFHPPIAWVIFLLPFILFLLLLSYHHCHRRMLTSQGIKKKTPKKIYKKESHLKWEKIVYFSHYFLLRWNYTLWTQRKNKKLLKTKGCVAGDENVEERNAMTIFLFSSMCLEPCASILSSFIHIDALSPRTQFGTISCERKLPSQIIYNRYMFVLLMLFILNDMNLSLFSSFPSCHYSPRLFYSSMFVLKRERERERGKKMKLHVLSSFVRRGTERKKLKNWHLRVHFQCLIFPSLRLFISKKIFPKKIYQKNSSWFSPFHEHFWCYLLATLKKNENKDCSRKTNICNKKHHIKRYSQIKRKKCRSRQNS